MKTQPIRPARIEFPADGTPDSPPRAPDFDDPYHPRVGALAQARHVFLGGNGLPGRWAGRARFTVLETGFGLGNNFLATWDAFRRDPARCERLHFVSIEKHPPTRDDLVRAHAGSPLPALAAELIAAWPPLTPNLHLLRFDGGRVRLLLGFGDIAALARELTLSADAFYLDGFAPARNPAMWDRHVLEALARKAAPDATAATWSVARELREGLRAAGFEVETRPGIGSKREVTVARIAPRFVPRRAPGRLVAPPPDGARRALIVGAGLAGAAAASALADLGWHCTVFDRHAGPAQETSGNPAGLFHGSLHPADGPHARFNRAAALAARRCYRPAIESGAVPGRIDGLLRLETGLPDREAMQALLDAQGLPPEYLQALSRADASALCGLPLPAPAWLYAGGGWLSPAALVRHELHGPRIEFRGGVEVDRLEPAAGGGWRLLGRAGEVLAEAPVLVLANAADAARLIGPHGDAAWPLSASRGQVSWWPQTPADLPQPRLPLAGSGYALNLPAIEASASDGLLCGASVAEGDSDAAIRPADHVHNLQRLLQLTGIDLPPNLLAQVPDPAGRVGWRLNTPDRLPLVGAVPVRSEDLPSGTRLDRARLVPRVPGLYVLAALGSRGIPWAPLAAQVLAAWIDGAPLPLESDLLDAIDPARFAVRAHTRGMQSASRRDG